MVVVDRVANPAIREERPTDRLFGALPPKFKCGEDLARFPPNSGRLHFSSKIANVPQDTSQHTASLHLIIIILFVSLRKN